MPYVSAMTDMPFQELEGVQREVLIAKVLRGAPLGLRPALPPSAASLTGPPLLPEPHEAERLYGELQRLTTRCWNANPLERPTMQEVACTLAAALSTVERANARQRQLQLQQQQQMRAGGAGGGGGGGGHGGHGAASGGAGALPGGGAGGNASGASRPAPPG